MQKVKTVITGILLLFLATSMASGQSESSSEDYFSGKWEVLIKGTPQGDAKMIFNLEREEDNLVGNITAEGQADAIKIDRIEEGEDSITAYWTAQGYNVYVKLDKKDENNMSGSLMNMFTTTATRIQE